MNAVWILFFAGLTALSPYAGQEQRQIKSLSDEEIQAYLQGKGQGLAKAAELNHYPGPIHVLQLKQDLQLDSQQIKRTEKIWQKMNQRAMLLGKEIVQLEEQLEKEFRSGKLQSKDLNTIVSKIAILRGKLRFTHLNAHIEQKKILNNEQIKHYDELRGYAHAQPGKHQHQHHH